jgi:ABC-type hemin transport system ATPase subunit
MYILLTHDVDLAVAWAKHLVIMDNGAVRLTGSSEEVYSNTEAVRSLNLNIPFVVETYAPEEK